MSEGPRGHRTRPVQWRPDRKATDPSRLAAYDILRAVGDEGAYANLVAQRVLADADLHGRDAAFATTLAYGTLRRRGFIDAVLEACSARPLAEIDAQVLDVVRLGAMQILYLGTPPHAAVGETVQLARLVGGEARSKFANAVLRRVGERDLDEWVEQVAPDPRTDPVGHLAVVQSHPRWIVEALHDALSAWTGDASWAETEDLLAADNEPGAVTLVARPGRCEVDDLLELPGTHRGRWSPYAVALEGGNPGAIPEVRSGDAGVQDEGSQLVAVALSRAPIEGPDSTWLDMAAGPGGKAALLAGLGLERGVRLLAAPCTGLGVLRRRPESRWRRSPTDVAELAALQTRLLAAAVDAVRVGGVVGYATCSPHVAETTVIVDSMVRRGGVERIDVRALLPEVDDLGEGPDLRLWPHVHGTDGMFLAVLRRTR
jgi:16S rRNA (cytosine967-C5)-methyltransferase